MKNTTLHFKYSCDKLDWYFISAVDSVVGPAETAWRKKSGKNLASDSQPDQN